MKSLFAFLFLFFTNTLLGSAQTAGYKVGDDATDFKLKNVDGQFVSLKDYKEAKGILLIFTCNHCPFSVAYEDRIIALHNQFSAKGFPVVAVNSNDPVSYPADSYENMIERANDKKFPFAYLFDETQEYAHKYGATKTPHVFVLRKIGDRFKVEYIGAIDDNSDDAEAVQSKYVESAVNALLAGKEVSPNFTKAVGCSIKWKKS